MKRQNNKIDNKMTPLKHKICLKRFNKMLRYKYITWNESFETKATN